MAARGTVENDVQALLARWNELVGRKDLAIMADFANDAVLVGSSAGEVAEGSAQIRALLQKAFAQPYDVSWHWNDLRASAQGDIAWFFADGEVVLSEDGRERRMPYRLGGVIQRQGERWIWRQFHGAEPSPDAAA